MLPKISLSDWGFTHKDYKGIFEGKPGMLKLEQGVTVLTQVEIESKPGEHLIRDRVMVEWVELGEGRSGDYDPEDPDDEELLRFDVSWLNDEGEWEDPGDVSYCTRFPASATVEQRQKGLEMLMAAFYEPLTDGHRCKKIGEEMSWIGTDWLEENKA